MLHSILLSGLALVVSGGSAESDINYVANSAVITLCGIECGTQLLYELDHYSAPVIPGQSCEVNGYRRTPILNVICDHTRWNSLDRRVIADSKSGCCTIGSVKKKDSGIYTLSLTGEDRKERLLRCYKYQVIDPVTIHNMTRQSGNLEVMMSLTVSYSGDQPVSIIWRKDEEDLPEECQLTHDNQTLIVPYNVTGNLTVTVSNPISMEKRNYTVSAIINPVTIHNITRQSGDLEKMISLTVFYSGDQPITIIWRKDEDLPEGCQLTRNNQTLIVPYNVTGNFTVTVSNIISMEKRNYTIPDIIATKPSTDRNHILVPIALVGIPTSLMMICRLFRKEHENM